MNDQQLLQELVRRRREQYASLLRTGGTCWDHCIITAANERQAEGYRAALELREKWGFFPRGTELTVLPDYQGKRIGSGGATILAADAVGQKDGFGDRRVLVIHCGGDSKRIPQYSSTGKIFATFPYSLPGHQTSTLFDEWFMALSLWAGRLREGMLVVSGDVVLTFPGDLLELDRPGLTGVACRADWQTAVRHGVYVTDSSGQVSHFLQKPSLDTLRTLGGMDMSGQALLDTGIMAFDAPSCDLLAGLAPLVAEAAENNVCIDLYEEIACALPPHTDCSGYLAQSPDGTNRSFREQLWDTLRGIPFHACVAHPAHFLHMGTTRQFRDTLVVEGLYDFPAVLHSAVGGRTLPPGLRVYDSVLPADVELGTGAVIERSRLGSGSRIGSGCVISGVEATVTLPPDTALSQVVVHTESHNGPLGVVTRIHGVADDPKKTLRSQEATLFGQSIEEWLQRFGIPVEEVWPEASADPQGFSDSAALWNARLYPVTADSASSYAAVAWMTGDGHGTDTVCEWLALPRLSLQEILEQSDCRASLEREQALAVAARIEFICELACSDEDVRPHFSRLPGLEVQLAAVRTLAELAHEAPTALQQARLAKVAADLAAFVAAAHEEISFAAVGRAIGEGIVRPSIVIRPGRDFSRRVVVEGAARADFGGGWSDTPPHSLDRGGTVLNAAITLDGQYPLRAWARLLPEPVIRLVSTDLDTREEITRLEELLNYDRPGEALILHKAACVVAGIAVPGDDRPLPELLHERIGCGLELGTESRLPKGCGLGGSSIAAGVALTALYQCLGVTVSDEQLFDHVLYLEQLLTTGGGWQDQIGGLTPGIKLVHTAPGVPQVPRIEPLELSSEIMDDLGRRLVLFYVGKARLAKNILRTVMGRYISRDPDVVEVLDSIRRIAREMAAALQRGDLQQFGTLMQTHWELNKRMDPDSTTPYIDLLFEAARPYMWGAKLVGAGGGGFMEIVARDDRRVGHLCAALKEVADAEGARTARVYDYEITAEPVRMYRE